MQKPLFRHLCARAYGTGVPIACFRAMFMNKPASRGTHLPWHQDVFRQLDRQPQITAWLALDDATIDKGCVQIIPRSHRQLVHPDTVSAFLDEAAVQCLLDEAEPVHLEARAGEAFLLHNWLAHSSGVNQTDAPRRAFSACYIDAATRSSDGTSFSLVFGEGALRPEALSEAMA